MRPIVRLAVLVSALVLPAATHAQSGTLWSLQGSALYVGLSGDAYEGLGGGIGAEGQLRYNFEKGWSLGGGLQFSTHSFDEGLSGADNLTLFGVFAEPRKVITTSSTRAFPYISARLAFLRQGTEVAGTSVSTTGLQINGGGGVLINVAPNTNLDLGMTLGAVSFGEYSTGIEAGSGTNFVLRAGISIGLGK